MDEVQDMSGKIPTFDGESRNFASWWKKFLAYATMNKFKDILKEGPKLTKKRGKC